MTVSVAWTRTGRWLKTRTAQDPRPPSLQDPAGPSLVTSFPSSFLGQEGTDSAQDSPPVVFTLSQEQASGASSGCGVLQRTATAAAGGGHRAASQLLPLLEPRPPWPPACPCELAAHSDGGRAPTQRVAFIFSCAVPREGREEKGKTASRPVSRQQQKPLLLIPREEETGVLGEAG